MDITSYQFEVAAKNAIIDITEKLYGKRPAIQEVQYVWYNKTLQNKKGLFIVLGDNCNYYEVTYDGDEEQLYVDTYVRINNTEIPKEQLNFTVTLVTAQNT